MAAKDMECIQQTGIRIEDIADMIGCRQLIIDNDSATEKLKLIINKVIIY